MPYTNVDALKGKDGPVYLWRITDFYDGLQSQAMIKGSYPSTTGNDETRQVSYPSPWSEDPVPVRTYWNEGRMQALAQLNVRERGAFLLNNAGSGITSRTIELLNGTKIYIQDARPQLSIRDAGGNLITSHDHIGYAMNHYANALYLMVDDLAQAAFFGVIYYNPTYEHGGSRQYCGFSLDGRTNDPDDRHAVYNALNGNFYVSDPYAPGGESEPSGPAAGNFDNTSDTVQMPPVPSLNLSVNGFVTAYAPTITQINDLASFIWSDWLSGGPTLPKIFANPEDAIISLHMLPFTPSTSSAVNVTVGHYASGVYMDPMTRQFYTINGGSLAIEEYWGNYLDYNPYTKLTLFMPYVGEVTLNPDEVMTHVITIKYRVDAMTGAFVCFILRDDDKILGEYQGNCSLQVPISSANYAQLHSALLGLAGAAVSLAAGAAGSGVSGLLSGGTNVLTSAAGTMDSKIRHSHSGALGSASGFMGSQAPYLIIERARQCVPVDLNRFAGYPSQITAKLKDLTGYTSVSEIVLDGIPLADEELTELREILKGGVYL